MPFTPQDVEAAARFCKGTSYSHEGRTPGEFLDCAGLLVHVARKVRCRFDDIQGYKSTDNGSLFLDQCRKYLIEIGLEIVQPGCIVLFELEAAPGTLHGAVVCKHPMKGLSIVHAFRSRSGRGKVAEHFLDEKWVARIRYAFKIPTVVYPGDIRNG